jgi:hypothetical protein
VKELCGLPNNAHQVFETDILPEDLSQFQVPIPARSRVEEEAPYQGALKWHSSVEGASEKQLDVSIYTLKR